MWTAWWLLIFFLLVTWMLLQLADKQKKPESDPNEGNDEEQRAHIAVAVYGICVWQFFFLGSGILWTVICLLRGMFRFSSRKVSIMKFRNWHSHLAIYSELKNTITMWWDMELQLIQNETSQNYFYRIPMRACWLKIPLGQ